MFTPGIPGGDGKTPIHSGGRWRRLTRSEPSQVVSRARNVYCGISGDWRFQRMDAGDCEGDHTKKVCSKRVGDSGERGCSSFHESIRWSTGIWCEGDEGVVEEKWDERVWNCYPHSFFVLKCKVDKGGGDYWKPLTVGRERTCLSPWLFSRNAVGVQSYWKRSREGRTVLL